MNERHVSRRQRQAHRPLLALIQPSVQRLPGGRGGGKAGGPPAKQHIHEGGSQAALALATQRLKGGEEKA